ncbi:MAG: hypothetical protein DI611_14750 [Brachybacterium faecium]|uniref:Rid family hydrolase n=1 Tax=Paracoccus aeridis TaxID=1966466 RepID=UPI000DB2F89C|nr:Rid family hydrolase [Paracoccus aeridis]PZP13433.1 MAG: hypothetical protein DI611_14750 [Brachybacterium faecium]
MTKSSSQRTNFSSGGAYEGQYGYSRAVRVGDQIYVSGTCAPAAHEHSDAYTQAKAALDVIGRALEQAGTTLEGVVRTVVYVRDMADADAIARAHLETFDAIRPASTMVQITSLLRPWQKVEIEAHAIA